MVSGSTSLLPSFAAVASGSRKVRKTIARFERLIECFSVLWIKVAGMEDLRSSYSVLFVFRSGMCVLFRSEELVRHNDLSLQHPRVLICIHLCNN